MNLQSKKIAVIVLCISTIFLVRWYYTRNISSFGLSSAPIPKCQAGFFYKTLPLISQQGYIINLDNIFTGYNISYSLEGAEQYTDNLTMKKKIELKGKQVPDQQLLGLKNYHIEKKNNVWGRSFIAFSSRNDKSYIHFGILNANDTAPIINNVVIVQSSKNTTCYDAVQFPLKDLILVDCVVKLQKPNPSGQYLQNIFYYIRLSDGTFVKTLKTQMYIDYTSITRRRLQIYSQLHSEHTFLLRTYMTDGVDSANAGNTYIDVFMISEPDKPWIVEIIDRSYFKVAALKIADIKIYLGEIYVLDQEKGVYRVKITFQEDLEFVGHYEARGFTRFSVFSNNLDDSFELALANSHSVYEIDWSEIDSPKLLNKYSLMPDSKIISIFLNSRFVANDSKISQNGIKYYNYTWILTRGSRTYTNAFLTLSHNTSQTFVDFNEGLSYLIVIDTYQLVNYKIDNANLIIRLSHDEDYLDKMMNFTVKANSTDQLSPNLPSYYNYGDYLMGMRDSQPCEITINFTLLQDNNRTLWPIGLQPPSNYVSNFPGKIIIPLYQYVLGPNITYTIKQISQGQIKKSKVYQNQQLVIKWQHQLPFGNNSFHMLKTMAVKQDIGEVLFIYMQDVQNITYISYCLPKELNVEVYCNQTTTQDVAGKLNDWIPVIVYSSYQRKDFHIVAYTITSHKNRIYLLDLGARREIQTINLEKGYAGQITSIQVAGKYLFVVLKYIKTIQVYDLQMCLQGLCQFIYRITHLMMYELGVSYFSPRTVHTSLFHPDVIFIRNADSIVALDVDKQGIPVLLSVVTPVPESEIQFVFKMTLNHMVITVPSLNRVQEYDISRIYFKQVTLTKRYPLYGSKIPRDFSFDVSDYGTAVFLSVVSQSDTRFVYVYKSGLPAVASLLNIVNLFVFGPTLIDVSGNNVDYITVVTEQELRIFRQHQTPIAQVQSAQKDYQFILQYSNSAVAAKLEIISVEIINLPTQISVAPFLQDIMNTKNLLFSGHNVLSQINDTNWYTGNVLRIYAQCRDCKDKVKVINHIQDEGLVEDFAPALSQYKWSYTGGTFQQVNNNIHVFHNGSVKNIVPLSDNQICYTITVSLYSQFQVSGCYDISTINLHLVSNVVQDKPFAFEPYVTKARNMLKLGSANELIILVESTNDPFSKQVPGGVFLYAIDEDLDSNFAFTELEYFDGYEIGGDLGFIYIVNAQLHYHSGTNVYRLYVTDIIKGVLIIEFSYSKAQKSITIKHVNFIDLQRLLSDQHKKIPYDATFQALALASSYYDPNDKQYYQELLVTTGVYHTLHLDLVYDLNGIIKTTKLNKLYLRYAFYIVDNDIKVHNDLFVIRQYLPLDFDNGTFNRQLLTVYDTRRPGNSTPQQRGMIGAFLSNDTLLHSFDFNLTYGDDQHIQPRINMVMVQNNKNQFQKLSLHRNLSVFTTQEVDTQIIYLDLYNDFSLKKIRILMNGASPFPEWIIVAIVLISIVGFLLIMGSGIVVARFIKVRRMGGLADEDVQHTGNRESQGSLYSDGNRRSMLTDHN